MDCTWCHSHLFWVFFVTLHCMGLSCARLTISKDCCVVSIEYCLHGGANCLFVNLSLSRFWTKAFVKSICCYAIRYLPIWFKHKWFVLQRDVNLIIGWNSDTFLCETVCDLTFERWAHPNTNRDVVQNFLILVLDWFDHILEIGCLLSDFSKIDY